MVWDNRASGDADGEDQLLAFARTYVQFATRHPALLGLMFARKDRSDSEELRRANERAFAAPSALFANALASGEISDENPDRVAMTLLAMLQGLASVIGGGMIGDRGPDVVVAGSIATLVRGLRNERS